MLAIANDWAVVRSHFRHHLYLKSSHFETLDSGKVKTDMQLGEKFRTSPS